MIRVAILTVSDRAARGEAEDLSGPAIVALVQEQLRASIAQRQIVPDEQALIQRTLVAWADSGEVDLILTTGGTGFAPRDVTPEATQAVIDRPAPGIAEALLATALGLLAAIPATIAYNKLSADAGKLALRMEGFADEFSAILSRQIDEKVPVRAAA